MADISSEITKELIRIQFPECRLSDSDMTEELINEFLLVMEKYRDVSLKEHLWNLNEFAYKWNLFGGVRE